MMSALIMAMAIAYRPTVTTTAAEMRLGDVADLSGLAPDLRDRAATLVVARRLPGQDTVVLDGLRITERARAQAPALAGHLPLSGQVRVRWVGVARAVPPAVPACAKVINTVRGGDFPVAADLEPTACPADFRPGRDLALDAAAGLVRASRDLEPGKVLIAPPAATLARYRAGQAFDLSVTVGPVKVQRLVQAARPVRPGANAVVRAADGVILFAPRPSEKSR